MFPNAPGSLNDGGRAERTVGVSGAPGGLRIGVDIGGTFTDVAVLDPTDGSIGYGKSLSTPDDLVRGIFDAISAAGVTPASADFIIHGSTVAINAILERKGAHTALITTGGFRDTYEIGRINRADSFNVFFRNRRAEVADDFREIRSSVWNCACACVRKCP
jgi:N-methylhydantoinase A/oxoprolinase/acetone carboxylase beta subunit